MCPYFHQMCTSPHNVWKSFKNFTFLSRAFLSGMLQLYISQMLQLITMIIIMKKKLSTTILSFQGSQRERFALVSYEQIEEHPTVLCKIALQKVMMIGIFLQRSCVENTNVSCITIIPCFFVLEALKYLGYHWVTTKRTSCICASTKNSKAITSMRNFNHGQYKINSCLIKE